jgi:uncharacterized protein with von Willebrand factor type A (vWA) domain
MMNSMDLLAKLLANENLNVIRANVRTASFENNSRTLTLPMWKEMTPEVEEMLIGHEVGHALYTTNEYYEKQDFRTIQSYMNVIEDVRIEKKIKNKYPGLRKAFIQAYKQLNEKDFFGLAETDLSDVLLIDRINLYYKCGINCGVKFSPAEMDLVRRADRCDTMEDVYNLSKEIYAFAKEERDQKKQKMQELKDLLGVEEPEEEDDDSFMDDPDDFDGGVPMDEEDEDLEKIEDDKESKKKTSMSDPNAERMENPEAEKEELESKTERAFSKRLSDLADTDTIVQYFSPVLASTRNPIVGYKTIVPEMRADFAENLKYRCDNYGESYIKNMDKTRIENLQKFKTDSMREVNYLVKEFEMRKSATEYKRLTTSKSGDLDARKLYAYSLTDDIFKKLDVVPEEKNHGMIFLLDWSGSMSDIMHDTIKQVVNLAMFCQRIQIPYQVFAFSSSYTDIGYEERNRMFIQDSDGFADTGFSLLEMFSNKMTNSEFNAMVEMLHAGPWTYSRRYSLNSTPLNESLVYLAGYIGKFIKNNSVEKMSLITLTDGEGHGLYGVHRSLRNYTYNSSIGKSCKQKNYLRDPITKKEYPFSDQGHEQTRSFLRLIKDRYQLKTVGFHIVSNSRRDVAGFMKHNMPNFSSASGEFMAVEQLRKHIRQNDYALITNAGRDELYLLPASKQKIQEGELEVKSDMNAKAIAKQFGKFLNVRKSSRVVLNRFVGVIA